jgi:hypothetical protein
MDYIVANGMQTAEGKLISLGFINNFLLKLRLFVHIQIEKFTSSWIPEKGCKIIRLPLYLERICELS